MLYPGLRAVCFAFGSFAVVGIPLQTQKLQPGLLCYALLCFLTLCYAMRGSLKNNISQSGFEAPCNSRGGLKFTSESPGGFKIAYKKKRGDREPKVPSPLPLPGKATPAHPPTAEAVAWVRLALLRFAFLLEALLCYALSRPSACVLCFWKLCYGVHPTADAEASVRLALLCFALLLEALVCYEG